ncbi:MAG TPA: acetylglutamate kinase [Gaiellaceae bacterium]|nr:acetylglutamate kinase [Gaiellaceae bacterium]
MSVVVVKCGGARVADAAAEIRELCGARDAAVVVHGGGPQISAAMAERGLPVTFVRGRRVTTPEALAVVEEELAAVNRALASALGPRAIGLRGDVIGLRADRVPELGLVGDARPCRPPAVVAAIGARFVPVVAPLAVGPLNVNADDAAAALAIGLEADRLVFLSDVPGVLREGAVVGSLGADEADRLLGSGAFDGGIVPKLTAAIRAARLGVPAAIGETAVTA